MRDNFKQESILILRNSDELTRISSVIILQELRAFCPWFHYILLASAALQQNDVKKAGPSGNSVPLAAAAICREVTSNLSSSLSDICSVVSQWREA